jgi:hypothetical protein
MIILNFIFAILASGLLSLRISPLFLDRIAIIVLFHVAALSFNAVYIQSIGFGKDNFSGLFHVVLTPQGTETCFYLVGALSLMLPIKPDKLNLTEQDSSLLPEELKQKLGFGNEISDTWLQWFIGFTEGDGAILSYKGQPQFVITQKEGKILYEIQSVLGFGTVRYFPNGNGYYRYIVTDSKGILLLCLLFNGNLVLPHRVEQLSQWIIDLNAKLTSSRSQIYGQIPQITAITDTTKPSLKNAWLSGFTDAELIFSLIVCKN